MKFRWWYGIVFNMALAALVITGAVFYAVHTRGSRGQTSVLEIRDADSSRRYGKWPLEEGGVFAVEFIHSVHQSPVRETFRIEGGTIRPVEARFSSFGAGMQSAPEEGQTMSRDGDALVIRGFGAVFGELNYIVGTVSDHLLYINGETVSLRNLCGRNAHITIRVK